MSGVMFVFGLGYSGRVLGRRLLVRGWEVRGTTRSADKAAQLERDGFRPFLFDRGRPLEEPARALDGVTHVLQSIAPDEAGDPVATAHLDDLRALPPLAWLGYLGTTAVYGNRDGAWVDETSELQPVQPRAARRAAAESIWLASGLPAHVFRLAGIYGPDRSQLDDLREGTARRIVKPGQVFSRIHVEDIAGTLEASIARPTPGAVYNVCDDEPAAPQEVIAFAAGLLGVAPPPETPFETAQLSPMARSFYADNRRVSNARIKDELGVSLGYPTYREGLRALLSQQ